MVLPQRRNRLPAKFMYVAAPMAAIRRIQNIASWGPALGRSTGFALIVKFARRLGTPYTEVPAGQESNREKSFRAETQARPSRYGSSRIGPIE
jgi:hypothetical protein